MTQPARFVLVGAGGYFANVASYAALLALGVRYAAASVLAYFLSNAAMYLGNRYFTFGLGHEDFWVSYLRYALAGVVVAALSTLTLAALVKGAHLDPRLGQMLALGAVTPVAFLLSKRFVFRPRPA